MKRSFLLVAILIMAGCSTSWVAEDPIGNLRGAGPTYIPKEFQRQTVSTGDLVIDSWQQEAYRAITILEEAKVTGENPRKVMSTVEVASTPFKVTVAPGVAMLEYTDNVYDYYTSKEQVLLDYRRALVVSGGVALNRSGKNHKVFWQSPHERIKLASPNTPIIFSDGPEFKSETSYIGFSQTMTYLGLSKNQVRFVYKEFDGNKIRSAFTQEFAFDYVPEKEYVFKAARFIIHNATANTIDYTPITTFRKSSD